MHTGINVRLFIQTRDCAKRCMVPLLGKEGRAIIVYNLAAEYAALIIIAIAMVGFIADRSMVASRYEGLKWMYSVTIISILITIISLLVGNNYTQFPLWCIDLFRTLYFIASPILALLYTVYSISIVHNKLGYSSFFSRFGWLLIPYVLYTIFVVTNPIHRLIFSVTPEQGYVKGPLVHASYYIALVYFIILVAFAVLHRRSPQFRVLKVVVLNFLVSTCIFGMQIFVPELQLSGLACVSGLLVVHLYILNVSKWTDRLTELNSRQALTAELNLLCEKHTPFSLVVFSLRNFKSINDRFGLEIGDELLVDLAMCFRSLIASKELYRYSGDEFAFLTTNVTENFDDFLKEVVEKACEPFDISGNAVTIDMVYARTDFPEFGINAKEIISALDYSISSVKKNIGQTNYFYDISIRSRIKRRNYIIERLKHAIDNDGFDVHYQAIYCAKTGSFSMAEALIRLKKSEQEPVGPGEFIPVAEEIGLVSKLTYIVLEKVCQDYRCFMDTYKNELPLKSISINLPYVHFLQKDTVQKLKHLLAKHQILHSQIKLELTERTLISDIPLARRIIDECVNEGFEFELDDFGVEYSNLSMLFNIPTNIIKFDRSLVYSATSDKQRRAFFEQLLQTILAANIQVVMEGVEEQELMQYLVKCGCDYIQGYVVAKPLPNDEFVKFLMESKNKV